MYPVLWIVNWFHRESLKICMISTLIRWWVLRWLRNYVLDIQIHPSKLLMCTCTDCIGKAVHRLRFLLLFFIFHFEGKEFLFKASYLFAALCPRVHVYPRFPCSWLPRVFSWHMPSLCFYNFSFDHHRISGHEWAGSVKLIWGIESWAYMLSSGVHLWGLLY